MGVELSQCVSQFPARLLLRQENHPLEIDRQAEAEYGLDEDADCLGIIKKIRCELSSLFELNKHKYVDS